MYPLNASFYYFTISQAVRILSHLTAFWQAQYGNPVAVIREGKPFNQPNLHISHIEQLPPSIEQPPLSPPERDFLL